MTCRRRSSWAAAGSLRMSTCLMPAQFGASQPQLKTMRAGSIGGACEGEQPLQIVGHGDQGPLAVDLVETSQQELAEAEHRLDDAEHRFGGVLAQGVQR